MWTAKKHFNHEIYTVFMYLQIFVCFKNRLVAFPNKDNTLFQQSFKRFNRSICNIEFSRWELTNIHEKIEPEKKIPDNRIVRIIEVRITEVRLY